MTTIAEALGITWEQRAHEENRAPKYRLTYHAQKQAAAKGWSCLQVLEAANNPQHTYPSGRVHGQFRHVRGNIVAIVDPAANRVVTVYRDVEETDLRADQTDMDARLYSSRRTTRLGQPVPVVVDEVTY
jgi:hypothetical protein